MEIEAGQGNKLVYRDTPWDERVFGFKTNEITALEYSSPEGLAGLLSSFEQRCQTDGVAFSYTRIPAADLTAKRALQNAGFYYTETSLKISCGTIQKTAWDEKLKNLLPITDAEDSDFQEIKRIAGSAFDFGRFQEDSNISKETNAKRNMLWIDDLRTQGASFLVYKPENSVVSFLAYRKGHLGLELILGGTDREKGLISPYFWVSFMDSFKRRGIKRVETLISAANLVILNLYIFLGFKVESTLIGFHKKR